MSIAFAFIIDVLKICRRTHERIMRYVMDSNYRHAKFAARLLALSKDSESVCTDVIEVTLLLSEKIAWF